MLLKVGVAKPADRTNWTWVVVYHAPTKQTGTPGRNHYFLDACDRLTHTPAVKLYARAKLLGEFSVYGQPECKGDQLKLKIPIEELAEFLTVYRGGETLTAQVDEKAFTGVLDFSEMPGCLILNKG